MTFKFSKSKNCGSFGGLGAYGTDSSAYSGTGFMGFAKGGVFSGYAEAIAKNLAQLLLPDIVYDISFSVRKANNGLYSEKWGLFFIFYTLNSKME